MYFTLNEALKIHPLNKVTILAGRNGLDRIIELFGILDAPDSVRFVKPNEFVMTTGYIFKDNPAIQKTIVEELCNRGASGLGIKIHRYIDNVLPEVVNFANENSFPLLVLPNEFSWFEMSSPILLKNFSEKQSTDTNFLNIIKEFSEKVVNINELDEILKLLYEVLKAPCSIFNKFNNTIINYPSDFMAPQSIGDVINSSNYQSNSLFTFQDLVRVPYVDDGEYSVIVAPISYKSNNYGYILVWEDQSRLTYKELSALQFALMSIRLSFKEFGNPKAELMNAQNEFLLKLLLEDIKNTDSAFIRANQLGIKLTEGYIVSVAEVIEKQVQDNTFSIKNNMSNKFQEHLHDISSKFDVLSCFGKLGEVLFLIPIPPNSNSEKEIKIIKAKIKEIKSELESSFPNMIFSFGVGKYYPKLQDLKSSYHEAITALKLGKKIFNNGSVTHFRDLGVYRFLTNTCIASELKSFINDFIAPIIKNDSENNSELLKTLKIFLECGRSNRKCAQKMYVHHNTIRYRLEQIEEICNLDINSSEDLLILEMALKILLLDNMDKY